MENQEVSVPSVINAAFDGKTPRTLWGVPSPSPATGYDFLETDHTVLNTSLKVGIEIEIEGFEGSIPDSDLEEISSAPDQEDYEDYDEWAEAFQIWSNQYDKSEEKIDKDLFLKKWGHGEFLAQAGWEMIKDGSLRNGGREFISKPAFYLGEATSWISELYKCLPISVDFNPRCAIHIHVGFNDVPFEKIRKFISLYYLFEWAVFNLTNANRRNNVFCVALQDTHDYLGYLNFSSTSEAYYKYSAFNICPLSKYGTIEFRHFESTGDISQIKKWLRIIDLLYDFAVVKHEGTFAEFMYDIFKLNSNSQFEQFGNKVFKDMWQEVSTGCLSSTEMVDAIIGMKGAFASQSVFEAEDLTAVLKQVQYKDYFHFPKFNKQLEL